MEALRLPLGGSRRLASVILERSEGRGSPKSALHFLGVPVEVGASTTRPLSRSDNLIRKAETRSNFALLPTKKLENASSQKFYNLCIAHKNQPKNRRTNFSLKFPKALSYNGLSGFAHSKEIHKFCVHFTKNGGLHAFFVYVDK